MALLSVVVCCPILKALHGFHEKKNPQVKGYAIFPSKRSK